MTAVLEPTVPAQRTGPASEAWVLVERAQAGDMTAWAEIWTRYHDTVHRFAWGRLRDRARAEDITSETFVRAQRNLGRVTWQGRDPSAWLVTIARNLIADHYKSGRTRLEVSIGNVIELDGHPVYGRQSSLGLTHTTAVVLAHMEGREVLAAVNRLKAEQREVVILRYLRDLTVAETAAAMGKNEGAVKALLYRAVKALHRDPAVQALRSEQ